LLVCLACSGGGSPADQAATDLGQLRLTATPEEIELLWTEAMDAYRIGEFVVTADNLERLVLEFPVGDPRVPKAHFYLGESYLAMQSQLQAVREFRRVSDQQPNHPLAPVALLRAADSYAEMWRRPELDPSYGQTALATYQELLNRYPETEAADRGRIRIRAIEESFAVKDYKTASYYLRLKAYNSAILYLKALIADYPRAEVAPQALASLVKAYRKLDYTEDVDETCGYMRRFHRDAPETAESCPAESLGS
jgi:outer membrane protein assembly factor BamD